MNETSKTAIPFVFNYENYRGEVSMRVVTPISVRFGSTDWHPSPQWLLLAFDHERQAEREFAMADMGTTTAAKPERERVIEELKHDLNISSDYDFRPWRQIARALKGDLA